MSKCDGLVIIVVVIAENVAIKGKQLRRRKRSNNSDSSDSGVKVIATSVRCADWLAFLARYRPLHLERPHQTRRLVPTQTRSRARAFTACAAFYLLLHALATGLQPIDRAHNPSRVTSSPLDLPLFPGR